MELKVDRLATQLGVARFSLAGSSMGGHIAALDAALREFHGDPERQLLTGLSIGGQGAWIVAAENPSRFAAIALLSFSAVPWPISNPRRDEWQSPPPIG